MNNTPFTTQLIALLTDADPRLGLVLRGVPWRYARVCTSCRRETVFYFAGQIAVGFEQRASICCWRGKQPIRINCYIKLVGIYHCSSSPRDIDLDAVPFWGPPVDGGRERDRADPVSPSRRLVVKHRFGPDRQAANLCQILLNCDVF